MDKQTGKLIARISENLPDMDKGLMQGWIDNPKALQKVLEEALCPPKNEEWYERDGVIYFSVVSNGLSGEQQIKHLEKLGYKIEDCVKSIFLSKDYKPSKKGTVHKIAVLKAELFLGESRVTRNIRMEADKLKLTKPNAEVACLIREKFTEKEIEAMGLYWIVVMHEPIKDSGGDLYLFGTNRNDSGSKLYADYDDPGHRWFNEHGFAFVAP